MMLRLVNIKLICIASGVCALIYWILIAQNYINNVDCFLKNQIKNNPTFGDTLLDHTRLRIKLDTWDYNFTHSGVNKLEDLVPESGGTPIRNIIVTSWRSGSSFTGSLISAVPATFYTYEPLMMFGLLSLIRRRTVSTRAIRVLKDILKCNYKNDILFKHNWINFLNVHNKFQRNERVWNQCDNKQRQCHDVDYITKICKLHPFQTIKVIRLSSLSYYKEILEDTELNVKIVLLVRDPRAVINSRRQIKNFCSNKNVSSADCAEPSLLCSDMINNYITAVDFLHTYSDRFMVLRFEDLAVNLDVVTLKLFKFLRLQLTPSVKYFLKTHTHKHDTLHSSTLRVTKDVPFKWKNTMNFHDVDVIQKKCRTAMSLWGYSLAHNASHMASADFKPLQPYTIA